MHNGEIIAYDISTSPNFGQINNMLNQAFKKYKKLDDLKLAIEEYLEYYNTQRIKVKLKGLTPVQYRNQPLSLAI